MRYLALLLLLTSCSPSTSYVRTCRYWDKQIRKKEEREQRRLQREFERQMNTNR